MTTPLPPPQENIFRDDYSAADSARQRLASKTPFPRFLSSPNLRRPVPKLNSLPQAAPSSQRPRLPCAETLIALNSMSLDQSNDRSDSYEWAIIYENQRGITVFSVPYYSRLSLLPTDPPPFTIPNTSTQGSKQVAITLADYPLPDGTWMWVSKCWMIDMRSDAGEVQHDGFEYNWIFRTHKWSAEVGPFSAGGWVRRRRWIRLMMRPATSKQIETSSHGGQSTLSVASGIGHRHSASSSRPPSVMQPGSQTLSNLMDIEGDWTDDDPDGNWTKCHAVMKRLSRDGRKLELWKIWLSYCRPAVHESVANRSKEDTKRNQDLLEPLEINGPSLSVTSNDIWVPAKEHLIPILRAHGNDLLQSLVYPHSRATFLRMLAEANLLAELNVGSHASAIGFWSYID